MKKWKDKSKLEKGLIITGGIATLISLVVLVRYSNKKAFDAGRTMSKIAFDKAIREAKRVARYNTLHSLGTDPNSEALKYLKAFYDVKDIIFK